MGSLIDNKENKNLKLLGYTQWRNFKNAIEKTKESCQNAGENTLYHFADVSKMIPMPKSN